MPQILLHACCGPCSTHCVKTLHLHGWEPTLFFSNSNINSEEEFERRLEALRSFAAAEKLPLLVDPYNPSSWREATRGYELEPEGGKRCAHCFFHNLCRTAKAAAENGFSSFTSSLTVSPHKSTAMVFRAGALAAEFFNSPTALDPALLDAPLPNTKLPEFSPAATDSAPRFECFNFKKNNGFLDSIALAKAHSLYRQSYCGCAFSMRNS